MLHNCLENARPYQYEIMRLSILCFYYSILVKVMLGGKITAIITEHGGTGAILHYSTIPALMRTTYKTVFSKN